jgi:hypothetical protein
LHPAPRRRARLAAMKTAPLYAGIRAAGP